MAPSSLSPRLSCLYVAVEPTDEFPAEEHVWLSGLEQLVAAPTGKEAFEVTGFNLIAALQTENAWELKHHASFLYNLVRSRQRRRRRKRYYTIPYGFLAGMVMIFGRSNLRRAI